MMSVGEWDNQRQNDTNRAEGIPVRIAFYIGKH